MRFVYALIAGLLWIWIFGTAIEQGLLNGVSPDAQFLSLAIFAAGAMAGGGSK